MTLNLPGNEQGKHVNNDEMLRNSKQRISVKIRKMEFLGNIMMTDGLENVTSCRTL